MNYTTLSELQLLCSILSNSIIARNAMLGWADGDVMDREDAYIKGQLEAIKEQISKIEKGDEK